MSSYFRVYLIDALKTPYAFICLRVWFDWLLFRPINIIILRMSILPLNRGSDSCLFNQKDKWKCIYEKWRPRYRFPLRSWVENGKGYEHAQNQFSKGYIQSAHAHVAVSFPVKSRCCWVVLSNKCRVIKCESF